QFCNSANSSMDKIKKENISKSFCKRVIDLTIDSSSDSYFLVIELDDLGVDIIVNEY
ncbi:18651_t:CDS:1, partial [Racocetra persica]